MQASTIDEVIDRLDGILGIAREQGSRRGYFPALYRTVTLAISDAIASGVFQDGKRMERLDVIFANRYLRAWDLNQGGQNPTESWRVAFTAGDRWWPLVLQHLLLGMNAHINLDLGIAAAQTSPGVRLAGLESDFRHVNTILGDQVKTLKRELARIWPMLSLLDRLAGESDDVIIRFSLSRAREHAWAVAGDLDRLEPDAWPARIAELDRGTAAFGRILWKPKLPLRLLHLFIRLGERGSVSDIIDILVSG